MSEVDEHGRKLVEVIQVTIGFTNGTSKMFEFESFTKLSDHSFGWDFLPFPDEVPALVHLNLSEVLWVTKETHHRYLG